MISGAHIVVCSQDAEADRAFFRDVLGLASVDAGQGWLIFAFPVAESAFHPSDQNGSHELYLMCDNIKEEIASLKIKGVSCSQIQEQKWGSLSHIQLPGGGRLGLYQPRHARPIAP